MRKIIIASVFLVAGLALFFWSRSASEPVAAPEHEQAGASQAVARPAAPPQQESPEDVGVKGTAKAGSTPMLAKAPSEGDGVLEVELLANGQPMPGAPVRLYWRGPRDPNLGEVSWRLASTGTTDAQGHARLASRPGSYLVAVHAEGYAALRREVVRPYGEALTVLRLTLQPGQSLSGRTVEQSSEEPLPLVELSLIRHEGRLQRWERAEAPAEERAYATSDERGNFRVDGLEAGEYTLEARAPGHARKALRTVKVPATGITVALQAAAVIEGFVVDAQGQPASGAEVQVSGRFPQVVSTGQGGGFSVEVEPGSHTVSARRGDEAGSLDRPVVAAAGRTVRDVRVQLGKGAVLEGRVVASSSGSPVAGASVDVSPHNTNGDSGRAVTDGDGRFSVGGLAPGSYDLAVSAQGFAQEAKRGLTVLSGDHFPLEIKLTGTGAVEGVVRDASGQPLRGVLVEESNLWAGFMGAKNSQARSDAEGHYRIDGLSADNHTISAKREGSTIGKSQQVRVKEGDTAHVDFTLDETGTVEGVVRADSGSLPPDPLTVTAMPADGPRFLFDRSSVARAEVDAGGTFRMELPPGSYSLQASSSDRPMFRGRDPKTVRVEAGKSVQVELTWKSGEADGPKIQGVVLEPDGTPSAGAVVSLSGRLGPPMSFGVAETDDEGHFTLAVVSRGGRAEDTFEVSARNGGRNGALQGVKAGDSQVVVRLQPMASVHGMVLPGNGGAPIQGFSLSLMSQASGSIGVMDGAYEFAGDRFELTEVPSEPVKLGVSTPDGRYGEATLSPTAGVASEVNITLSASASVKGRLLDATTQAPLTTARIYVEGAHAQGGSMEVGPDGRFSIGGLSAGDHMLIIVAVASSGRSVDRRTITVTEGQELDLGDITLNAASTPPGSIGVAVRPEGTQLVISRVLQGSPAEQVGLQAGDVLLSVDDTPVKTQGDAFTRLHGAPGAPVSLLIQRGGTQRVFTVSRAR